MALTDYSIDVPTDVNRIPTGFVALPKGRSASIDISFLNINELDGVRDEFLRPELGRRLVVYWYWELPNLPTWLVPEVLRFDENLGCEPLRAGQLRPIRQLSHCRYAVGRCPRGGPSPLSSGLWPFRNLVRLSLRISDASSSVVVWKNRSRSLSFWAHIHSQRSGCGSLSSDENDEP